MARRRAIQGDTERQLLDALRAGAFVREAAEHVGVGETTVYREMEANREFREAVTRARADARVGAIAVVRRAMAEDWKAAAFYLERTDPQNWGRSTRHEHSGPAGAPIQTAETADGDLLADLGDMTEEELAQLREIRARARERSRGDDRP